MISVVIIGSGNVAQHLISAFVKSETVDVIQVFSRNLDADIKNFEASKITNDFEQLKEADLYIISVTDTAVHAVSNQIPFEKKLVVHTSGSVAISELNEKNKRGVFYPLQTFSKNKSVDFSEIPICIEAENETDYQLLEKVGKSISEKIFNINSEQRKALHVAAVFSCNFVNHLYAIGNKICDENEIPFEILQPLIIETANKIKTLTPVEAQTGPAKRNDTQTINAHLNFLQETTQKEIYKILTKSIIDNGKKL
ncbi:DUF2520 domain-containing protein [Flavobacterium amnicola]|uniref:DUF2520 domain-containing protein n=1 Tax=Flavobacterium amnicola TaxID=2506422 RepID=A0A4Q1K224_9FLAO|nr:DUF2520 domain-containing protein [Flavobacterium amnicola]RXR18412.1 DUF2520 domain-containing protein [Flavobacterium amnicola]